MVSYMPPPALWLCDPISPIIFKDIELMISTIIFKESCDHVQSKRVDEFKSYCQCYSFAQIKFTSYLF